MFKSHDQRYGQVCAAFDVISSALYFGPAFRDMLMRDSKAYVAAIRLAQAIKDDERLKELMS